MHSMKLAVNAALILSLLLHVGEGGSCPDGFYGPSCGLKCGDHCLQSVCEAEPSKGTFSCSLGCVEGWTGQTCDRKCPLGCQSCDRDRGTCTDCLPGWCGDKCSKRCSANYTVTSVSNCMDQECSLCEEGWRGVHCNSQCPQHCEAGCNKTSGECSHQCVKGHHGVYCSYMCTSTCNDGCRQSNGVCTGGCHSGWYGAYCNISCDISCAGGMCFQMSGECTVVSTAVAGAVVQPRCRLAWSDGERVRNCSAGCEPGWRGERCDQVCPDQCYSCSRYPDAHLCVYTADVIVVKEYGVHVDYGEGFQLRVIYALLLVIPPFLIVGFMQLFKVCYDKYKKRRDLKHGYVVNQQKTEL